MKAEGGGVVKSYLQISLPHKYISVQPLSQGPNKARSSTCAPKLGKPKHKRILQHKLQGRNTGNRPIDQLDKTGRYWDHDYVWTTDDDMLADSPEGKRYILRHLCDLERRPCARMVHHRVHPLCPSTVTNWVRDDSWTSLDQELEGLSTQIRHTSIDGHIEHRVKMTCQQLHLSNNGSWYGINNDCRQQLA